MSVGIPERWRWTRSSPRISVLKSLPMAKLVNFSAWEMLARSGG